MAQLQSRLAGGDEPESAATAPRRRKRRGASAKTAKILVVGNAKCGKTSLIRRYTDDSFGEEYRCTIGADYARRDVPLPLPPRRRGRREDKDDGVVPEAEEGIEGKLRLQIWDIAGQDRFVRLTRAFFARARGAIIVADLTRDATFEAAKRWKEELDEWAEHNCSQRRLPVILVANKSDLLQEPEAAFQAGALCERVQKECGFASWHLTSAKSDVNVGEAFLDLLHHVHEEETEKHRQAASDGGESQGMYSEARLPGVVDLRQAAGGDVRGATGKADDACCI